MICIIDSVTDPYWNLAAEEYLLKYMDQPVFRLWRNEKAIIVGKHQNAIAEVNADFVKANHIAVVRRISGGGAVFHDMGNILFTFADRKPGNHDTAEMFRIFTRPILDALNNLGVKAYLEGRNDLLIDGKKFSGNSLAYHRDRILQHGTLLFSSSMDDLSAALNARPEKFTGKAVQSMRARVTNISDYLKEPMSVEEFMQYMADYIGKSGMLSEFTEKQKAEITELRNSKYVTDEWNYGKSPKCTYKSVKKYPSGLMEMFTDVENGRIEDISIKGDYFFTENTSDFEELLRGCRYDRSEVENRLRDVEISRYFSGFTLENVLDSMFAQASPLVFD